MNDSLGCAVERDGQLGSNDKNIELADVARETRNGDRVRVPLMCFHIVILLLLFSVIKVSS